MKFLIGILIVALASLALVGETEGHYRPGTHNTIHAINLHWCGHVKRECREGEEAKRVCWCESKFYKFAVNGQYRGLFQMGWDERRLFGHGNSAWKQAKAAHRYYVVSGRDWSPWGCKP